MNGHDEEREYLQRELAAKKEACRRAASPRPRIGSAQSAPRAGSGHSVRSALLARALKNPGATAAVVFAVASAVGPWRGVRLAMRGAALVSMVSRLSGETGRRR